MPARPPYFAFYPEDFAGDELVEAMSTTAVGAYILLLCKAWKSEPVGSLPDDDKVLAKLARVTPKVWEKIKHEVRSVFIVGLDKRLYQKRLVSEHKKAMELIERKSRGGEKGASARWKENNVGNQVLRSDGSPIGTPNGTPIGTPNAEPMPTQCGVNATKIEIQNHCPTDNDDPPSGGSGKPTKKDVAPRKESSGFHHECIREFGRQWELRYKKKYKFAKGRDGEAMKQIIEYMEANGGKEMPVFSKAVESYLECSDRFFIENTHPIYVMNNEVHRWFVKAEIKMKPTASLDERVRESSRRLEASLTTRAGRIEIPKRNDTLPEQGTTNERVDDLSLFSSIEKRAVGEVSDRLHDAGAGDSGRDSPTTVEG